MATITKPMALDETLQSTNVKLQGIINAIGGNNPIIGDTDISGIADGTLTGAVAEFNTSKADVSDLPTVNNSTITLQENNVTVDTFTLNQSSNKTINISMPTALSELTNDEGFTVVEGSDINGNIKIDNVETKVYDDSAFYDEVTTEGNPLEIKLRENEDAENTLIEINPKQNLHGFTKPWIGGEGKNLAKVTLDNAKSCNTAGTWSGNEYTIQNVKFTVLTDSDNNVIGVNADGTNSGGDVLFSFYTNLYAGSYVMSGCPGVGAGDTYFFQARKPGTSIDYKDFGNGESFTLSSYTSDIDIRIVVKGGATANNLTFYPMVRFSGTTSDYESYTNICNISGSNSVETTVKDEEQTTKQDLIIPFGQTLYGCSVDVEQGKAIVDRIIAVFDGSNDEGWGKSTGASQYEYFYINITGVKAIGADLSLLLCDKAETAQVGLTNDYIGINTVTDQIRYRYVKSNSPTVSDLRSRLSVSPIQVCYPLQDAYKQTIALTPAQLHLFKGINNISTTGDKITITYKDIPFAEKSDIEKAKILTDTVTGDKYILVVTNGVLSVEQISN